VRKSLYKIKQNSLQPPLTTSRTTKKGISPYNTIPIFKMQKFFAVAALLVSMTSMVLAAPVPAPVGIQPEGINDFGNDGRPSMVDTATGEIIPFDTDKVDATPQKNRA
jgi:hypothetical protein